MKKWFLIITCIILTTGCSYKIENVSDIQEKDDGIINVLYYYHDNAGYESDSNVRAAVKMLQEYGKQNNVKVEIIKYTSDELSYDDYVLKRNTMIQNNETDIVFDLNDRLYDIRDKSGDYSKLDTYENIWDNLKGYYCIPLYLYSTAEKLNDASWKVYDIKPEKDVFTRQEYYEIKQLMKGKGARFALNRCELIELTEYYIIKNNVMISESDGVYKVDKHALKQTINEIYEDIKNNYDKFDKSRVKKANNDLEIKDETSGEVISDWNTILFKYMSSYEMITEFVYNFGDYNENKKSQDSSICISDIGINTGITNSVQFPCLFIRKNSAEEVYKAASVLFTERYYKIINPQGRKLMNSPVIDTLGIREYIQVDDNWRYNGDIYNDGADKKGVELINRYYEILRQKDLSNVFMGRGLNMGVQNFVMQEMEKLIEQPEQINNLDKDIDDFKINLDIKYNS